MNLGDKISAYKLRAQLLTGQADRTAETLASELIDELQRLADENTRLRKALVQSTQSPDKPDKLKNALLE